MFRGSPIARPKKTALERNSHYGRTALQENPLYQSIIFSQKLKYFSRLNQYFDYFTGMSICCLSVHSWVRLSIFFYPYAWVRQLNSSIFAHRHVSHPFLISLTLSDAPREQRVLEKTMNCVQVRFPQKESKSLSKFTSENLKIMWLEDGCLAGGNF